MDATYYIAATIFLCYGIYKTLCEKKEEAAAKQQSTIAKWRQLQQGITAAQVKAILGEPSHITVSGDSAKWHYDGDGTVVFTKDKVVGWQEPS